MFVKILVVLLFTLIHVNDALIPLPGACDAGLKIPALTWDQFDVHRYMGHWWMNQTYETQWGNCVRLTYTHVGHNAFHDHMEHILNNGSLQKHDGPAGPTNVKGATWEVNMTTSYAPGKVLVSPHWVLGIKYNSWAVMWACVTINDTTLGGSFIVSRHPVMSAKAQAEANAVIDKAGIDRSHFVVHKNTNCPY